MGSKKRKLSNFIIFFLLASILLVPMVEARKGIGLKWSLNSLMVEEGKELCVEYGVYNPWEEDVQVKLDLSDNLKEITTKQFTESKFIAAQTSSQNSLPVTTCFMVDNVYQKNCLLGSYLCKKDCTEGQKVFDGEILALEDKDTGIAGEGTAGSGTNIGISTTLKVKVSCESFERDWTPVIVIVIVIIILLVGVLALKPKAKPKSQRKKRRA